MTTVEEFLKAARRDPPLRVPYNFVPLNAKVLETPWQGELDLSTPHAEGLCGQLMVEWRIETPLLVGGRDNNSPFQLGEGGPYAIPGASLRGMIRAVLEILSYADLGFYQDQRFSLRDYDAVTWQEIQKKTPGKRETITRADGQQVTFQVPVAGWLQKAGDHCRLTACEQVKIPVSHLCTALGVDGEKAWHTTPLHERHSKLAAAQLDGVIDLGRISPALKGKCGTLVVGGLIKSEAERRQESSASRIARPEQRESARSKVNEIAFIDILSGQSWTICEAAFKAFSVVQVADGAAHKGQPEENWSFWKPKFEAGQKVPVFYRGDPSTAAHHVSKPDEFVMALTRLMRVPHRFTTADVLARTQKERLPSTKLDFVQALFGHVPQADEEAVPPGSADGAQRAWRSRVRFGLATLAEGERAKPLDPRSAVTMKPRASFYPFYLQPAAGKADIKHPVDWSNPNARLAGRKRYPARNEACQELPHSSKENPEQENPLTFLDASADRPLIFRSAIRFHNLLPQELGGLVWAIGLRHPGGTDNRHLCHMLGRAKGFGYGQVRATILADLPDFWIEPNSLGDVPSLAVCVDDFETWVAKGLGSSRPFDELPEVAALLAMCDAELGSELREALRFPRSPENGSPEDEAERVLKAYSTIKERTACKPKDLNSDRQGGRSISLKPEDESYLFLPSYPPSDESSE